MTNVPNRLTLCGENDAVFAPLHRSPIELSDHGTRAARLADRGLAVVAACTGLYALVSIALPFGWDHGIIASVASSYVHGGLPYVDSWDMKGPVAYLPFALAEAFFGRTMWGVRLIDLAAWAVAGIVLYDGVRSLTTPRIGTGVALATFLWIASAGWFFTATPESWVTTSCIVAIVPLLNPASKTMLRSFAVAGLLIGFAGLVKPFYFGFGLAPLVSLALMPEVALRRRFSLALALALGALVPPIFTAGYFAIRGGLALAIEVHVLYPLTTYAAGATLGMMYHGILGFLEAPAVFITAPFALAALWLWRSQPRVPGTLLAWLVVALLCVVLQGKYFVYHWFPVYPPLFILGGLGAHALLRLDARSLRTSTIVAICGTVVLAAVLVKPLIDVAKFGYFRLLKQDEARYYGTYGLRLYSAADEIAAARYVAAHTGRHDGVFIWGADATVRYLADRPNPSRFTFALPLSVPGAYRAAYRAEALRDVTAHPPTYFITGIAWDGLSKATITAADFPAMAKFLQQNYAVEKSIGILDLYRLRSHPVQVEGR